MPEPVIHSASRNYIEVPPRPVNVPPKPAVEGDPLLLFENYHFQVRTDLHNWMTFSFDQRVQKAKKFAHMKAEDEKTMKLDPARRHKILCYIIWLEAHHQLGRREVAAVAFNGLFPKGE